MLTRRDCLKQAGLGLLAAGFPGLVLAKAETEARLVLVILRGAVDGLALVAPYGDPNYGKLRGELAIPAPGETGGLLKLDGLFGLNPALANMHTFYQAEEALFLHAVASPYRSRSHFDGQDVLENGTLTAGGSRDGWLNRALASLPGAASKAGAIAMAQNTPLVLRGDHPVSNWTPSRMPDAQDETLMRIQSLYADDEFFSSRLEMALNSQEIAGESQSAKRGRNRQAQASELIAATAKFLRAADGPRIAVLEAGGWDTHANQGSSTGGLANRLKELDAGIGEFKKAMGPAWANTVVAVVTEFGRTVKVNGTRGTDHGTGGAAMLLGGAVRGGRVVADWPGLQDSALYEGRDLYPTTDIRAVFKGLLSQHWDIRNKALDQQVFPGSKAIRPLEGLVRT